ncbi:MAG: WbqC family protein [Nitrososphaerales archaeon]
MKVAIHQPHYFPHPGFFHKLSLADVFVIMDDVQYDKRFTNRNRILDPHGPLWLTVPINKSHKFLPNMHVEINNDMQWREDHLTKILGSYSNASYFFLYRDYFENLYKRDWKTLFELDYETTKKTMEWLGINIPVIKESELNAKGESNERLINVCKSLGADTYVSGTGAKAYLDERLFEKNNLKVEFQNYTQTPYTQKFSEIFIPDLSIIDMLANVDPQSGFFGRREAILIPNL